MAAVKLLISLPQDLTTRFRALVPVRQRSQVIRCLLEEEVKKREQQLYDSACAVEADKKLGEDMQDWDITLNDGIEDSNDDEAW